MGATGVKMTGPYEYIAPSYWYLDTKFGGAHGFNTETSPGPAPPPIESLRRMLPEDKLWPINPAWDYHAGGGAFKDIHVFTEALNARYGTAASVEDYARKAQMMAYEGHRAMFEAFGRNKYTSTGVIQWMLNNAWPGLIWHLYDWYLRPGGSYFGAKKANQPLHVQYSYDDRSVVVVNSFYQPFTRMRVVARVVQPRHDAEVRTQRAGGHSGRQQHARADDPRTGRPEPDLFRQPGAGGPLRRSGGPQLLLALLQAGNPGLGQVELVHDPHQIVRRLHRAEYPAAGRT